MNAYTRWERTAQVLIVLVVGLLMLAGVASASAGSASTGSASGRRPPVPATVFTAGTAADAMRQAVVYLDETGSDPVEVYITGPAVSSDAVWRVVIVE